MHRTEAVFIIKLDTHLYLCDVVYVPIYRCFFCPFHLQLDQKLADASRAEGKAIRKLAKSLEWLAGYIPIVGESMKEIATEIVSYIYHTHSCFYSS